MLSTLDYANIGVTASAVTSYMYVLNVALKVRQSLAVGQYRRHALGIGIVAIVFVADQVSNFFPALNTGIWNYLGLATFAAFALGLLYWVDSSVLAARRSDPLYRDTFHWSKLRWVAWGASVAAFVFVIGTSLALPPPSSTAPPPGVQVPPEWLNLLFTVVFLLPIYTAAISGVVVIPLAARRCKDFVFRKHLEWFFLFIAIQLILAGGVGQLFQSPSGTSTISSLIDGIGLLVGLYPLYQSVKRLVPLYKFSTEDNDSVH